jgi:hypothetical protein
MKRVGTISVISAFLLAVSLMAGIGSKDTAYVGGTVSSIKEQTEGKSSTADEKVFTFQYGHGRLTIPYERINALEYGQKAGRRIGVAIAVSPIARDRCVPNRPVV